ncbi:hypothetical protein BX257_0943 [Streptomyces sp. 3212.3]|nr:hypothetical protein BX257_0943 [Streptomyces sp. 3212.3]
MGAGCCGLPVTLFGQRRRPGCRGTGRARGSGSCSSGACLAACTGTACARVARTTRPAGKRRRSSSRCRGPAVRPPSPDPRVPRPDRSSGTRCPLHLRGGPGLGRCVEADDGAGHGVHLLVVVPGPGVRFQRRGARGRRGRGRRSRTGADRPMSRRPEQGGRADVRRVVLPAASADPTIDVRSRRTGRARATASWSVRTGARFRSAGRRRPGSGRGGAGHGSRNRAACRAWCPEYGAPRPRGRHGRTPAPAPLRAAPR